MTRRHTIKRHEKLFTIKENVMNQSTIRFRKKSLTLAIAIATFQLAACGGGGGGSAAPSGPTVLTGQFAGGAVEGMRYKTLTQDGATNANG